MKIKRFLKANVVAIAALGIVGAISAFTLSDPEELDEYSFTGTQFNQTAVETNSNWSLSGSPSAENCGESIQDVTCKMRIPKGYADVNGHPNTSVDIEAVPKLNPADPTLLANVKDGSTTILRGQDDGTIPEEE